MINKNEIKESINYLITISDEFYGSKNILQDRITSDIDVLLAYSKSKNADALGHELIYDLKNIISDVKRQLKSEEKVILEKELIPLTTFLKEMSILLPKDLY